MALIYKVGFPDMYKPDWCEIAFYLHDWERVIRDYSPNKGYERMNNANRI